MLNRYSRSLMTASSIRLATSRAAKSTGADSTISIYEAWKNPALPSDIRNQIVWEFNVSDDADMSYYKARLYMQCGKIYLYDSLKCFDDALKHDSAWVEVYIGRAFTNRLLGSQYFKDADADFAKALSLDPKRAKAAFDEYSKLIQETAERFEDKSISEELFNLPNGYNESSDTRESTPFKDYHFLGDYPRSSPFS